MNKLLLIAISLLTLSCHRQALPEVAVVKDSTYQEVKSVLKDSVITIPGKEVGVTTNLATLLAEMERLKSVSENDSVAVVVGSDSLFALYSSSRDSARRLQFYQTPFLLSTNQNLKALVSVDRNGNVRFQCKEDSLKQRISWLENQLRIVRDKTTVITKQVPVEVPKRYIPSWLLWFAVISGAINLYQVRAKIREFVGHTIKPW